MPYRFEKFMDSVKRFLAIAFSLKITEADDTVIITPNFGTNVHMVVFSFSLAFIAPNRRRWIAQAARSGFVEAFFTLSLRICKLTPQIWDHVEDFELPLTKIAICLLHPPIIAAVTRTFDNIFLEHGPRPFSKFQNQRLREAWIDLHAIAWNKREDLRTFRRLRRQILSGCENPEVSVVQSDVPCHDCSFISV